MKSDDVVGRVKTYEAIVKGANISDPGIPESFKVMLKELQALALDVTVLDEDGNEVIMGENVEENDNSEDVTPLIDGGAVASPLKLQVIPRVPQKSCRKLNLRQTLGMSPH